MNALDLLIQQHREINALFDECEKADEARQVVLQEQIGDLLAIHASIEEQIFYPSVKRKETEGLLEHSVEEHLEAKQLADELLSSEEEDTMPLFRKLVGSVRHHLQDEENELFPRVRKLLSEKELNAMGDQMVKLADQIAEEEVPSERAEEEKNTPAPL